jgi:hypothetical protein
MGDNIKYNERCIKGNTTYYKIKIDEMIQYEIDKLGANTNSYKKFNLKISDKFLKFTDKLVSGGSFDQAITILRDQIITECVETENDSSSKMRPFFRDYIFDKVYTMGINIKKGILPDDCEQELEEARKKMEEENELRMQQEQQEEKDKNEQENEVKIVVENETEERDPDIVDQMWNYFFGGSSSKSSKSDKKPEKDKSEKTEEIEDKEKVKA